MWWLGLYQRVSFGGIGSEIQEKTVWATDGQYRKEKRGKGDGEKRKTDDKKEVRHTNHIVYCSSQTEYRYFLTLIQPRHHHFRHHKTRCCHHPPPSSSNSQSLFPVYLPGRKWLQLCHAGDSSRLQSARALQSSHWSPELVVEGLVGDFQQMPQVFELESVEGWKPVRLCHHL